MTVRNFFHLIFAGLVVGGLISAFVYDDTRTGLACTFAGISLYCFSWFLRRQNEDTGGDNGIKVSSRPERQDGVLSGPSGLYNYPTTTDPALKRSDGPMPPADKEEGKQTDQPVSEQKGPTMFEKFGNALAEHPFATMAWLSLATSFVLFIFGWNADEKTGFFLAGALFLVLSVGCFLAHAGKLSDTVEVVMKKYKAPAAFALSLAAMFFIGLYAHERGFHFWEPPLFWVAAACALLFGRVTAGNVTKKEWVGMVVILGASIIWFMFTSTEFNPLDHVSVSVEPEGAVAQGLSWAAAGMFGLLFIGLVAVVLHFGKKK